MAQAALVGATVLSTVGTIVSANSAATASKAEGASARNAAEFQQAQYNQRAGQELASSQRQAIEERRKADLAISRARAIAAGSGGSATDPTVMKIYNDLASEGEYNALSALYEGDEAATGLRMQGAAARYEGESAYQAGQYKSSAYRRAGYLQGVGTALSGVSDFYTKYGNPLDSSSWSSDPANWAINR